ncbi:hypothetical protein EMIHUDRAFT_455708, partial [Emiliania huxleyi CCMP1516]|uniref:Uncharacterized protein n=2 Tax=Emiliania huxleyi TaxID=2903 RepID=A0A0D3KDC5_EMIH1
PVLLGARDGRLHPAQDGQTVANVRRAAQEQTRPVGLQGAPRPLAGAAHRHRVWGGRGWRRSSGRGARGWRRRDGLGLDPARPEPSVCESELHGAAARLPRGDGVRPAVHAAANLLPVRHLHRAGRLLPRPRRSPRPAAAGALPRLPLRHRPGVALPALLARLQAAERGCVEGGQGAADAARRHIHEPEASGVERRAACRQAAAEDGAAALRNRDPGAGVGRAGVARGFGRPPRDGRRGRRLRVGGGASVPAAAHERDRHAGAVCRGGGPGRVRDGQPAVDLPSDRHGLAREDDRPRPHLVLRQRARRAPDRGGAGARRAERAGLASVVRAVRPDGACSQAL